MISPARAAVKPRVICRESGEVLPLEDEILRLAESGKRGIVALMGGPGSGKRTALRHLAAVLPAEAGVLVLDEQEEGTLLEQLKRHGSTGARPALYVCPAPLARSAAILPPYQLAPWGDDEFIEYLLAVHKPRCAPVMARLRNADRPLFDGIPEVCRVVLDQLAADDSIPDARTALYRAVQAQLPDTDLLERSRSACLNALARGGKGDPGPAERLGQCGFPPGLVRILRHPPVQQLLASERVAADLHGEADCDFLGLRLPVDLLRASAAALRGDQRAIDHLKSLLAGPSWSHPMAASILHLVTSWRPEPKGVWNLVGAYLEGARWPCVQLACTNLAGADLTQADLRGALLDRAIADGALLFGARLDDALLNSVQARGANLSCAAMKNVTAVGACFVDADLRSAKFQGALLKGASFQHALLGSADFSGASLVQADFRRARVTDADFSGANLSEAYLGGLCLREAVLAGACFAQACLAGCDLEEVDLPGAHFPRANLDGALLTGSSMPGACFERANLCAAGLAGINWEGADLRGANLSGATFHLGSSRSGLVFSPIASEGSRTGFYTDDYEEKYFKEPEELRKANLCGADLRGAEVGDVDFYLVDLRGAKYDPEQEEHFRRCGAFLDDRA